MATDKRSRTYLSIAIGAFVAVLVAAFLYMFADFGGIDEQEPVADVDAEGFP